MDRSVVQKKRMSGPIPAYVLDDLSSRFIINTRPDEINTSARLFFLIENAHWFYLDFHRVENPQLKDCSMREFAYCLINHCPLLKKYVPEFDKHFEHWRLYKRSITTCGAIILDERMQFVLLVQSYSCKTSWGFPKGKVNQGESTAQCAVREVLEETGFDITPYLEPDEYLERELNEQKSVLYIVTGVSLDSSFAPKTRCEIRDIQWFPLDSLPTYRGDQSLKEAVGQNVKLYTVMPFIRPMKQWISNRLQSGATKGKGRQKQQQKLTTQYFHHSSQDAQQSKKGKGATAKNVVTQQKPGAVRYSKDIIESQGASVKQSRRAMTVFQTLFGNKESQQEAPRYKAPEIDLNFFHSEAWLNFSLDTDSMLQSFPQPGSYYLPKSYTHQREVVGAK